VFAVDAVLAFRATRHHLDAPAATLVDAAGSWALQDSPPGSAPLALAARLVDLAPGDLERALGEEKSLLALYNARAAIAIVPAADAATFGAALLPTGDDERTALLANALPEDGSVGPAEAMELTGAAIAEALDGRSLSRDELHAELRARLPAALLPWCKGCKSRHVRRWLLNTACLRGELCIAGRAGRQPAFARPDQWLGRSLPAVEPAVAQAELARRYLRHYAPSTPAQLAEWAGIPRTHAERCWAGVADELAESGDGWALAADADLDAPPALGVRLLPPGDPFLLARDRERLVGDPGRRKQLWRAINAPGAVWADGDLAGIWRARKQGKRLAVEVAGFSPLGRKLRSAVAAVAAEIAPLRGCTTAEVAFPA
jgi:hypothetical protein